METDISSYRGYRYGVRAEAAGDLWVGHFQLIHGPSGLPPTASNKSTPLDPAWATAHEAETHATERAHAVIDALVDTADLPPRT